MRGIRYLNGYGGSGYQGDVFVVSSISLLVAEESKHTRTTLQTDVKTSNIFQREISTTHYRKSSNLVRVEK